MININDINFSEISKEIVSMILVANEKINKTYGYLDNYERYSIELVIEFTLKEEIKKVDVFAATPTKTDDK